MVSRSIQERITDVEKRFQTNVNAWVASASATGETWLIPLTFQWNGTDLLLATTAKSRTARNLLRAGVVRLALGATNDVIIVEGSVTAAQGTEIDPARAEAHAQRAGFDPRQQDDYVYLVVHPRTIQAWSGPAEMADRVVMRDGHWLATAGRHEP
ncbi:MAG: hypothetical protein QM589_07765 [Thermomicrobiales bacterium]